MSLPSFLKHSLLSLAIAATIIHPTFAAQTKDLAFILAGGSSGDEAYSEDGGITWTTYFAKVPVQFSSMLRNGPFYFAVGNQGDGVVMRSDDNGSSWTDTTLPTYYPTQIIFANNQFVLINGNNVATSPDGFAWDWTNHEIPAPVNYPYLFLTGIAYGNGMYVTVGNAGGFANKKMDAGNCIATSSDGVNWNLVVPTPNAFTSVIFANNQFIATGKNGLISTSSNGVDWTAQTSGVLDDLGRIIFANNTYVVFGASNTESPFVLTSVDAVHWVRNALPVSQDQSFTLSSITYADNLFILTGGQFGNSPPLGGVIFTSPDGVTWTQRLSGFQGIAGPEALLAVA